MKPNSLLAANPGSLVSQRLLDFIVGDENSLNRIFYFGEVLQVDTDNNSNRIKVRIPTIDDVYFQDEKGNPISKDKAKENLPWCIPANNRFIYTPDLGAVVLVAIFDIESPRINRIWFTDVLELNSDLIFSLNKLKTDLKSTDAWNNVEQNTEIKYNNIPGLRSREEWNYQDNNINYLLGIRGKGNNKVILDQNNLIIVQNYQDNNSQTIITLNNNVNVESKQKIILDCIQDFELTSQQNINLTAQQNVNIKGINISLISSLGTNQYHPLFDEPFITYLNGPLMTYLTAVATAVPALSTALATLQTATGTYSQVGVSSSQHININ